MALIVQRFDLDETPREPNTERTSPTWWPLPLSFPFVVDDETGEVIEPILLYLKDKYTGPRAAAQGRWTKLNSALAAGNDLRDWWETVRASGRPWYEADGDLADAYLMAMKSELSGATDDFLADETIKRRRSTLSSFHIWGRRQGYPDLPVTLSRSLNAYEIDDNSAFGRGERLARYDANPRPLDERIIPKVLNELGPLPSERPAQAQLRSSRSRLAFEIALTIGLRVDEIVKLDAGRIKAMTIDDLDDDAVVPDQLKRTKGLVRRTVYWPVYLIRELQTYISTERARAISRARLTWLKKGMRPARALLLNTADAKRNAGKATTAETLEADLAQALMRLGIVSQRIRAEGSAKQKITIQPKHTFHDGRHTFAYMVYLAAKASNDPTPEHVVRLRLGHADVTTTINIYLRVFEAIGGEALERTASFIRQVVRINQRG